MSPKRCKSYLSFAAGALAGVVLHYALYRMGLPIEPFIYMAF